MRCNGTNECRSYLINGTFSSDASSFWAGVFFMCLIIIPFIFIVVQENILFSEESDVIKVLNNLDMWGISLLSLSLSLSPSLSHCIARYDMNYQLIIKMLRIFFQTYFPVVNKRCYRIYIPPSVISVKAGLSDTSGDT